jgi:hypothetical protein
MSTVDGRRQLFSNRPAANAHAVAAIGTATASRVNLVNAAAWIHRQVQSPATGSSAPYSSTFSTVSATPANTAATPAATTRRRARLVHDTRTPSQTASSRPAT